MASDPSLEPLFTAALIGNIKEFKRLAKGTKVDLSVTDDYGDTSLHISSSKGHDDVVSFILSVDSSFINAQNKAGSTPLHKAAGGNKMRVCKALLSNKADTTIRNQAGFLAEEITTNSKIRQLIWGNDSVSVSVKIPKTLHGRVIGKGASTKREIEDTTCTILTFPNPDDPSNVVKVEGREENVTKSTLKIRQAAGLECPLDADIMNADDAATASYPFAREKAGLLVGKGGQKLRDLNEKHSVFIAIPPDGHVGDFELVIKGRVDDIDRAIQDIIEISKKGFSSPNQRRGGGRGRGRGSGRGGKEGGGGRGGRRGGKEGGGKKNGGGGGRGRGNNNKNGEEKSTSNEQGAKKANQGAEGDDAKKKRKPRKKNNNNSAKKEGGDSPATQKTSVEKPSSAPAKSDEASK